MVTSDKVIGSEKMTSDKLLCLISESVQVDKEDKYFAFIDSALNCLPQSSHKYFFHGMRVGYVHQESTDVPFSVIYVVQVA